MQPADPHDLAPWWLKSLTGLALLFALFILAIRLGQPILEAHGFRQTQTALTAYWCMADGFRLDYWTPVAGAPWRIPFEFPLYQGIVALLAAAGSLPLDATGRVVSFAFFIATPLPAMQLLGRLGLSERTRWLFALLFLTCPLYLFWGRTFMIESTALFFTVYTLAGAIPLLRGQATPRQVLLLAVFCSAALLQKITTALPPLGLIGLCWLWQASHGQLKQHGWRYVAQAALALGLPVALALAWTFHADAVKQTNAFGAQLTSHALASWNYGSADQRLSHALWHGVVLIRGLKQTLCAWLGALLIALVVVREPRSRAVRLIAICALLYLAPLLAFTNLHIVHDYYQNACALFLVAALAIAVGESATLRRAGPTAFTVLVALLLVGNLVNFRNGYWSAALRQPIAPQAARTLQLADAIRSQSWPGDSIVVFGDDWNSEIPYYARRKGFVVPNWFAGFDRAAANPDIYLAGQAPAAIVYCPEAAGKPVADLMAKLHDPDDYRTQTVADCTLRLRRNKPSHP